MIPVVVRRLAEADIAQVAEWYAGEDMRLGVRFTEEVSRAIDRIGTLPEQFPEIRPGVRRALFHTFPYAMYFVRRENVAIVIAVLHQRRRPGTWTRRARLEPAG